jgi:hypothetical protein
MKGSGFQVKWSFDIVEIISRIIGESQMGKIRIGSTEEEWY